MRLVETFSLSSFFFYFEMSLGLQFLNASLTAFGGGGKFLHVIFTVYTRCDAEPRILQPTSFQGGSRIPVAGDTPASPDELSGKGIIGGVPLP